MKQHGPQLYSFSDVVHWVVEECGAMCPSPRRLAEYRENPQDKQFGDIRYHVEEAGCRICRALLDILAGERRTI